MAAALSAQRMAVFPADTLPTKSKEGGGGGTLPLCSLPCFILSAESTPLSRMAQHLAQKGIHTVWLA